jgi:signal transduction histidine kinase
VPPAHTGALRRASVRGGWRAAAGVLLALVILSGGRIAERLTFGATEADTVRRVAAAVRGDLASMTAGLEETARRVAVDPARLATAADAEAMRRLFDSSARALDAAGGASAITIYSATGVPLAWAGRPSELPTERITGPPALFVAPGPLGARLVHIGPIISSDASNTRADGPNTHGQPPRRRVGAIAVERRLGDLPELDTPASPGIRFDTGIVPVLLRPRYEGGGETRPPYGFVVNGPDSRALVEAEIEPGAIAASRRAFGRVAVRWALLTLAITALVAVVPFVELRQRTRDRQLFIVGTLIVAVALVAAAALGSAAVPRAWWWGPAHGDPLSRLLRSPAHLLAMSLAAFGLVTLAADLVERRRRARRHAGAPATPRARAAFVLAQIAAGVFLAGVIAAHHALFTRIVPAAGDVLQFSLHPFTIARATLLCAIVLLHAVLLWAAIVVLRLAVTAWRVRRDQLGLRALVAALWLLPTVVLVSALPARSIGVRAGIVAPALAAVVGTALLRWLVPRYRHASQAWRLVVRFCALALPALVFYPALVALADEAIEHTIEDTLAPQALAHRTALQEQLRQSLREIDAMPGLVDLVAAAHAAEGETPSSDPAFAIWRQTDLARQRLTSSVELYAPDGELVSRFALNLPAETGTQQWTESGCAWDVFGEPIAGGEDRVLLHAGRGLCDDGRVPRGAIVVHVMLDYGTLPFLTARNPYGDLLPSSGEVPGDAHGRAISFAVYGWGRTPVFPAEGTAWPISSELLSRIYGAGRTPLWTVIARADRQWRVLCLNDRSGIYALGYPVLRPIDHLVSLAELLTLAGVVFVGLLLATSAVSALGGYRASTARDLMREIRGSFYRKLFLAFVAASVVPVIALAILTRAYIATQLRDSIESAAGRTASVAKRVVDSVASQQRRDSGVPPVLTDELMIGVSRIINQDVNVFTGPRLTATSQRDLFASGLLPMRTPAAVYRALVLERQASYVGEEEIADVPYMIAAAPVREGEVRTTLTVPLALRQQEIEREIDALDRRVLLATVCFILLGAGIGYSMAERIADPISRLTRATRRIAAGDFDARIAVSSSDEFRRLVEAFNSMAADLARQREQLERTHRLEAWADMARQVAHDIKNPLTPIQLSAEHLRRVHEDRGEPLSPVLESCVATILSQVRLLRQISAEFSSFASSPVARLAPVTLDEIVDEVIAPYRAAPPPQVTIETDLRTAGVSLLLDRALVGRALVNVVENALHAMPNGGRLTVRSSAAPGQMTLTVTDTGIGMDAEARERLFEPYFSTRAAGTGLGLTIAKRNVELNGGEIAVDTAPGDGTTVTIEFPFR